MRCDRAFAGPVAWSLGGMPVADRMTLRGRILQQSWQFRAVYQSGNKIVTHHAVVFFADPADASTGPRIGVVASKKVGNAVRRNRAKRVLREAARRLTGRLAHRDIWIVLVAKGSIIGQNAQTVTDDLDRALSDLLGDTD